MNSNQQERSNGRNRGVKYGEAERLGLSGFNKGTNSFNDLLLGSEDDDNEDDVNLVIHHDSDSAEEEKKGNGSRSKAIAEIDAESVLVKSVT